MNLSGLVLETIYFEDYLSFLTEVLELDLEALAENEMRLNLDRTWLRIKKAPSEIKSGLSQIQFSFTPEEFDSIRKKVTFFYYRRGENKFSLLEENESFFNLLDPDGRIWSFSKIINLSNVYSASVRNC